MSYSLGLYSLAFGYFLGVDPYVRTPGSLLITQASAWRLNSAERILGTNTLAHFPNAHIAIHRHERDVTLVIDPEKVETEEQAFVEFSESRSGQLYMNPQAFIERLRALSVRLPPGEVTFSPEIPSATQFLRMTELQSWTAFIHPTLPAEESAPAATPGTAGMLPGMPTMNPVAPVPLPPLQSTLIQWGNSTTLPARAETASTSAAIFAEHFYKIPLTVEVKEGRLSAPGDSTKLTGDIPVYLVKSKHSSIHSGYLVAMTAHAGRQQVIMIELPTFTVSSSTSAYEVKLPSKCFLDQLIGPIFRRPGMVCSRQGTGGAATACTSAGGNRFEITLRGRVNSTSEENSPTISFSARRNTLSYDIELKRSDTETPFPVTDAMEKIILRETSRGPAANAVIGCRAIPLTPVASAAPGTRP